MAKGCKVKVGRVSLTIYRHGNGWRFVYPTPDGRRYVKRATQEDAKEEARRVAAMLNNESLELNDLSPQQVRLVREFLALDPRPDDLDLIRASRGSPLSIGEAIDQFLGWKVAATGRKTKHLRRVEIDLLDLRDTVGDAPLAAISPELIRQWIEDHGVGAKRANDLRSAAVALWRWAVRQGTLSSQLGLTAPERVPARKVEQPDLKRLLTPSELSELFRRVEAPFRPWLALSAFSGLRSGEIFDWAKPPLRWEQIGERFIDLLPSQSKTRRRRLVPVLPALVRHLPKNRPTGPILCEPASTRETARLGEKLGGWPRNCLRHSFGSYRVAVLQDIPAVALEMGNSPAMVERHYLEAASKEEGEAWFAV